MKKKITVVSAVVAFIACLITPIVHEQFQKAEVILTAPLECRVGELITFDASGSKMDNITWNISPSTINFKIIDGGKQAIFSSEKIGDYVITVAVVNGKKVDLSIIELTVYSSTPPPLINKDGVKDLIDDKLPDSVKQVINLDQVKNLLDAVLPSEDENLLPPGIQLFDEIEDEEEQVDIRSWLLSKDPILLKRIIKSLDILHKLMDQEKFETQDEMIQAMVWSIKRATHEDVAWEPFILNLSKYLENSDSKQDCIQKTKAVLTNLKRINNEKT